MITLIKGTEILKECFEKGGKIVWLSGKRWTGKTTLVKTLAEKTGSCEYIDFEETDVGEGVHRWHKGDKVEGFLLTLENLAKTKKVVVLDNYDVRFQKNERSFMEVSRLQNKLEEWGSTIVVISREKLLMYPMFVYMASLDSEHNVRLEMNGLEFRDIAMHFGDVSGHFKAYSFKDQLLMASALDGAFPWLASGLSAEKSVKENIVSLLASRDEWLKQIMDSHELGERSLDEVCNVYRTVARGIDRSRDIRVENPSVTVEDLDDRSPKYCFPFIMRLRCFDFREHRVKPFIRFGIADQSVKFFFRFVYDYNPKTNAEEYYNEKIAPYHDEFAADYWHQINFKDKEYYFAVEGRKSGEGPDVKVHIMVYGRERLPYPPIYFCDYNVSDVPYDMERLQALIAKKEAMEPGDMEIAFAVFSLSGFTAEVEDYAGKNGVKLFLGSWKED